MENKQNLLEPGKDPDDKLNVGLQILSFCIPVGGAVIYFLNKESRPKSAKTACHSALWGIGVGIFLNLLMTLMYRQ